MSNEKQPQYWEATAPAIEAQSSSQAKYVFDPGSEEYFIDSLL